MSAVFTPSMRNLLSMVDRDFTDKRRVNVKTPERQAVEEAMQTATRDNPLTPEQIARKAGLSIGEARKYIGNICGKGSAHNTNPGQRGAASYAWGRPGARAPAPAVTAAPQPAMALVTVKEGKAYDGAELRPFEGRPGALAAFNLPSLVDGRRLERRAPMLLASKPEVRR
jgi:hypothetical protein